MPHKEWHESRTSEGGHPADTDSPMAVYLQGCSFYEQILVSLVKCMDLKGIEEIKLGEVSPLSLCPTTIH